MPYPGDLRDLLLNSSAEVKSNATLVGQSAAALSASEFDANQHEPVEAHLPASH